MSEPVLYDGGFAVDDRGTVSFVNTFKDFDKIKRFYIVENHTGGFVRAWHGHKNEEKYAFVVQGTVSFGVVPLGSEPKDARNLKKYILSDKKPQILYIPAGNYNGFKTLTKNAKILFFSTSTLEESIKDDIRKDYLAWDIWSEIYR